ncbi:MAG: NYN domain-containing protein [Acidobacteria bacterium]|nr:NYN domain-containing protein [Acidobacteriota bacterium]
MEERHRIAVFIDFDNIEIGVKNTLGRTFDVSPVLEALKERGEVLTKIAYADWTRHGEMSRSFSQHGVQMVQRHPGPRGDKNGADINLALDALEMALTKPHIDAFAIVSGDSDFISLVEKLKQYNKTVFVVGGRAFTSTILQKNCREFISYESLLTPNDATVHKQGRGPQRPAPRPQAALPLSNVTPLLHRALEVLARREVQPQLGLLKSTMLQLDSSFTERDYGASSFRQFVEMLAKNHIVTISRVSGHYLVELPRTDERARVEEPLPREDALPALDKALRIIDENDLWGQLDFNAVKEYVHRVAPDFDEKRYGFGQFAEVLNFAQDAGLLRMEPDENSVLRVYPGTEFTPTRPSKPVPVVLPPIPVRHPAVPREIPRSEFLEAPAPEPAQETEREAVPVMAEAESYMTESQQAPAEPGSTEPAEAPSEKPAPRTKRPSRPATGSRPRTSRPRRPRPGKT